MTIVNEQLLKQLRDYFAKRDDVVLAYLFGSQAKGTASSTRSDADFAIYFKPKTGVFEYEESEWGDIDYHYEAEDGIQDDLSKITDKEVDLVVLNRAPAYLDATILKEGILLKESDREIYWKLYLRSTSDAEDYHQFFKEYREIMERSHSLSDEERLRLDRIITCLLRELHLNKEYGNIDENAYKQNDIKRKVLERNIENIVNAGLDIAKIFLAANYHTVPNTYVESMHMLVKLTDFDPEIAKELAKAAKLRNFVAHEYLEYRWKNIEGFVVGAQKNFGYLIEFAKTQMEKN
ncbi:MAG: nucleotidyltransferase domain-containing protein [Candidatus Vogelbacteria bacterium]|nr:nucleotidyltransferase domain-containing protein [Candidatus Vogelbacteria bacterium]